MLTTDGPTRSTRGVKSGSPPTSTGDDEATADTDATDASWLAAEEGLTGNAEAEFLHPTPPVTNRNARSADPAGRHLQQRRIRANGARTTEKPEETEGIREGIRIPKATTSSKNKYCLLAEAKILTRSHSASNTGTAADRNTLLQRSLYGRYRASTACCRAACGTAPMAVSW